MGFVLLKLAIMLPSYPGSSCLVGGPVRLHATISFPVMHSLLLAHLCLSLVTVNHPKNVRDLVRI